MRQQGASDDSANMKVALEKSEESSTRPLDTVVLSITSMHGDEIGWMGCGVYVNGIGIWSWTMDTRSSDTNGNMPSRTAPNFEFCVDTM